VYRGEVFGLLSPNRAGKTTTIEIVGAYRTRSAGEVSLLGVDPARRTAAWRNRVGVVLQNSQLLHPDNVARCSPRDEFSSSACGARRCLHSPSLPVEGTATAEQ
jgi:ABC-type uncharacterized transport system ATPase subunit